MSTVVLPTRDFPLPLASFGFPFIVETLSFVVDPTFSLKRQARYGSIFKTQILGRKTVVMTGSEANCLLLSTHGRGLKPCESFWVKP